MSPVVRAEKAAEAEGSTPYRLESLCPVVTLRHTILEGGEQSIRHACSSRRQAWRPAMNKEEGND